MDTMKKKNTIEISPETLSDMLRFAFANGAIFGVSDEKNSYEGYSERRTKAFAENIAEIRRVYCVEIPLNS